MGLQFSWIHKKDGFRAGYPQNMEHLIDLLFIFGLNLYYIIF